jgi:hypothetical protein
MEIGHVNTELNPENRIDSKPYLTENGLESFMNDLIRTGQWDYDKIRDSEGKEIVWSEEKAKILFDQYLQGFRSFNRAIYETKIGGTVERIETSVNIVIGNLYCIVGDKVYHLVQEGKKDDASVSGKREFIDIENDDPEAVNQALKKAIEGQLPKLDQDRCHIGEDLLQEFTEDWSRGFPIWTHTEARGKNVLVAEVTPEEFQNGYKSTDGKNLSVWKEISDTELPEEIKLLARQ